MAYKVPPGYQPNNCSSFIDNIAGIINTIAAMNSSIEAAVLQITSVKTQLSNNGLSQAERDILNAELDALAAAINDVLVQKVTATDNLIAETESYRVCNAASGGMDFRLSGPNNLAPATPYIGYMYYNTSYMMPTWFDGYQYLTDEGTYPGTDILSPYNPLTYINGMRSGVTAIVSYESNNSALPPTIYDLGLGSTYNTQFNLVTRTTPDRTILYQQYPILNQGIVGRYLQVYPTDSEPTFYAETDFAAALAAA